MKKIISSILILLLTFSVLPHSQAQAATLNASEETITVQRINSSEYILSINEESAIINYTVENNVTTINVTEIETGDTYFYIRDLNNNTLYSSQTNATIPLPAEASKNTTDSVSTFATAKFVETKSVKTADIAEGVIKTATLVKIATFILSYVGLVGAATAGIVDCLADAGISGVMSLYNKYKYVKFDIYETIRSTTKNGKVYKYTVTTYKNVRLVKR